MEMTLAQFALAVNAEPKWVQNASAAIGLYLRYSEDEARQLGLAKLIQETAGTPLRGAWEMAGQALANNSPTLAIVAETGDGSVRLIVDVHRYLCTFSAWLSRAYVYEPRRRGRPAVREQGPGWEDAYGISVAHITANMRRPLEDRLAEADDAAELMNRYRVKGIR